MKIGVSTYSFKKYMTASGCSLFDVCDKAKELGFEGIDFIEIPAESQEERLETAKKLREKCESLGLPIAAYTVGANFLADDIEAEKQRLRNCVDICEALGAPVMRHDVASALRKRPLYSYRQAIPEMAPHIREISLYAKQKGIKTCSENHGYVFQDPHRVEALILAVNEPNYGWLCDIGNFLCADCDPANSVAIAAQYTIHAHVKDFLFKSGDGRAPVGFFRTNGGNYLRGTVIGHGVVPVERCIGILKKAGYDGCLSVEFEGAEENLPALKDGLAFLKQIV